ncbi:hypothetical protein [Streptomyces sp. SYSU K21746]
MARLIGSAEVETAIDYGTWGLVDEACLADTHTPDAPSGSWIQVARGMAYLQCPSAVVDVRVRLESWTTAPPPDPARWSGSAEAEVELPSGELGIHTVDGGWDLAGDLPFAVPGRR